MVRYNCLLHSLSIVFFLFSLNCFSQVYAHDNDPIDAFKNTHNDRNVVRDALNIFNLDDQILGCGVLNIDLDSLNVNLIDTLKGAISTSKIVGEKESCSRTCRSDCSVPFLLRYGKYCGLLYSGCPGEEPCDGLDECCKKHDECVGQINYLSEECNQNLLDCMTEYKKSGGQYHTFEGNTCDMDKVMCDVSTVIKIAFLVGQTLPGKN